MNNAAIKIENELSPMTKKEFEQKLRDIGKERYHDNCKFHHLLHSGMLNKGQVQAWALNRYYYQINISIKDSALMSRIKDPELRRVWVKRILDHDGRKDDEGGIERWYKLTDGLDLNRNYVKSTEGRPENDACKSPSAACCDQTMLNSLTNRERSNGSSALSTS